MQQGNCVTKRGGRKNTSQKCLLKMLRGKKTKERHEFVIEKEGESLIDGEMTKELQTERI